MSHSTTTNDKAKPAAEKAKPELLLAMLAADWVTGDKHHYAEIRHQALLALAEAGKDGAEALARLEGMGGVPGLVHAAAVVAKA